MYKNYIFDLYGTLADIRTNENSPYLWRKMSEFYAALGAVYTARELKLEYRRLVDRAAALASEKLLADEGWKALQFHNGECKVSGEHQAKRAGIEAEPDLTAVFAQLFTEKGVSCDPSQARLTAILFRTLSRSRLCLYDGVIDFLTELRARGKRIYLLSNAQKDFTEPELDRLGLIPYFDCIYISSDRGVKKPSPLFFRMLLEEQGLKAADCVMIGNDEHSDIAGARAVGMDCLYLHTDISPQVTGKVDADYLVMDGDFRKISGLILKSAAQD